MMMLYIVHAAVPAILLRWDLVIPGPWWTSCARIQLLMLHPFSPSSIMSSALSLRHRLIWYNGFPLEFALGASPTHSLHSGLCIGFVDILSRTCAAISSTSNCHLQLKHPCSSSSMGASVAGCLSLPSCIGVLVFFLGVICMPVQLRHTKSLGYTC